MALRIAHGALSCVRRELGARSPAARLLASSSCRGPAPPPCAPCAPAPRPPCRAAPRATRRVCCPPPAGAAPPCAPQPCAPHLTCRDRVSRKQDSRRACSTAEGCGADRDRVARRLSLAEESRRRDYEREVAARPSARAPAPPPAPYALGAERECARATDGRQYTLRCSRRAPEPCSPGRLPPAPRCFELVRDAACSVRDNAHLDPCAHAPRTIVDIDRSGAGAAPARAEPPRPSAPPEPTPPLGRSPPARNLTSRIMEKLSLSRSPGASCPRRSAEPRCDATGARRAGDAGWCRTQPEPPAVPPGCREPTTLEKIKRRGPTPCARPREDGSGRRCFHTSAGGRAAAPAACESGKGSPAATVAPGRGPEDAESLNKVLKERESLREAGRGRVVGETRGAAPSSTTGKLDIPVPPGARNVRIQVSLDGAPRPCCRSKSESETTKVTCSASDGAAANSDKTEPWLSLRSLQKKLASCRKTDTVKIVKKNEGGKTPASCPRPQPPRPKSPAPRGPCAAPTPPAPRSPCGSPTPTVPRSPCSSPAPAAPRSPCAKPAPSAPSAPSAPPRRTCPTHGKPDPLKPKRFSIVTDSDSLIAETLFIKW